MNNIAGFIGSGEIMIIVLIALLVSVLPIFALIDILRSEFKGNDKIVWVIVVIFFWLPGSLLYFFIGRKQKTKSF